MIDVCVMIPTPIEKYSVYYAQFIEGMLYKLHKNAHKDTPTTHNIPEMLELLQGEIKEFKAQFYENKYDNNTLVELFDVANFAFLMYVALRAQGVSHADYNRTAGQ